MKKVLVMARVEIFATPYLNARDERTCTGLGRSAQELGRFASLHDAGPYPSPPQIDMAESRRMRGERMARPDRCSSRRRSPSVVMH
jgi:hypothetical protein